MFIFKEFSICDDKSSMKVGTDSCLLGVATKVDNANRILDVGTGCGILAIMLAQKSNAYIDAIDIDEESCNQARGNFSQSKWENRLSVCCEDFLEYSNKTNIKYDVIVSNPPFFEPAIKINNSKRHNARYTTKLDFNGLCSSSSKLMSEEGFLSVIIPYNRLSDFITSSLKSDLFINEMLLINSVEKNKLNRYVIKLSKSKSEKIDFQRLTIRNIDGKYSKEYIEFMKDFQNLDKTYR